MGINIKVMRRDKFSATTAAVTDGRHGEQRYIITYHAQTNEPGPGGLVNVPSHRGSRARGGWGVGLGNKDT